MTGPVTVAGTPVAPGARAELRIKVGETYTATPVSLPVTVIHGPEPGPVLGVLAAIHGDELNGIAIVRRLLYELDLDDLCGTLIACPVVNVFGVLNRSRYLPDRRDLNRSFPGSASGSLASRIANVLLEEVVAKCDAIIDLHTAGSGRTNLPQVRGDLTDPRVYEMATAFGSPLVVNAVFRSGSLREAAAKRDIPVLLFEGGEPFKFQGPVVEQGVGGIVNVMAAHGMVPPPPVVDVEQVIVGSSSWVRAENGGILDFRVGLGQVVESGQDLFATTNIFGRERSVTTAGDDGYVIGLSTLPLVNPGDAVVHLGFPGGGPFAVDDEEEGTA